MSSKVEGMMDSTINKIKEIVNADTIIGKSITTSDGTVVIPVSKVTYGFASGGSDFAVNKDKYGDREMFGGGNGVGVSIIPVAFLVVSEGNVKLLQVESFSGALDRIISMTPDVVDKIGHAIKNFKNKNKKNNEKNDNN